MFSPNPISPPVSTPPSPPRAPVKVALLSLPPRTQSLLEFFFNQAGRGSFLVTPEEQAEAAIFDLDTAASHQHWQQFRQRTGAAGVALSVKPQSVDGAWFVQKPVTPAALLAAAAQLRAMPGGPPVAEEPAPVGTGPAPAPAAEAAAASAAASPVASPAAAEAASAPPAVPAVPPVSEAIAPPPAPPGAVAEPPPSATGSATAGPVAGRATLPDVPSAAAPAPAPAPASESESAPGPEPVTVPAPEHPPAQAAHTPEPSPNTRAAVRRFWQRWFGDPPAGSASPQPTEALAQATTNGALDAQPEPPAPPQPLAARAHDAPATPAPATEASPAPAPAPASRPLPGPEAHDAPDHDTRFYGSWPDASAQQWRETPERQYDPQRYLVGLLREAYLVSSKWQVATQIELQAHPLLIDAQRNELVCALTAAELDSWACTELPQRSKVRTLSEVEAAQLRKHSDPAPTPAPTPGHAPGTPGTHSPATPKHAAVLTHRLDDALWRSALLAAAGRLPAGTDPLRTSYLRQWPNLTRITRTAQVERLSALWALRGSSVMEASQHKIQQRHVVGFYNGVWALNLLTDDGALARQMQRKGARNRGLLSRLLGWLRR